jgi:hypothetical protein
MAPSARTWYAKFTRPTSLISSRFLQYRARDSPWYTLGHGIVLVYIGLGVLTSAVYWLTLRVENSRRDRGSRDEIIDGVNDNGTHKLHDIPTICVDLFGSVMIGDPETVERLTRLNGRFATVEDAKNEKGDRWSGYRYVL